MDNQVNAVLNDDFIVKNNKVIINDSALAELRNQEEGILILSLSAGQENWFFLHYNLIGQRLETFLL